MDTGWCIYFGEKPFYITSTLNEDAYALTCMGGTIVLNQPDAHSIPFAINELVHSAAGAAIILSRNPSIFWQAFKDEFDPISAGGGLVLNDEGQMLFMFRRGKWDLPKGKLDDDETIAQCAMREVAEETGATNISIVADLGKTYHTYMEKGHFMLKDTQWYLMKAEGEQQLLPQEEEGISQLLWVDPNNMQEQLANTYPSVLEVLKCYQELKGEN